MKIAKKTICIGVMLIAVFAIFGCRGPSCSCEPWIPLDERYPGAFGMYDYAGFTFSTDGLEGGGH